MDDSAILDRRLNCIERRLARLEAGAGLPPEPDLPRRRDRAEPGAAPAAAPGAAETAARMSAAPEPPGVMPVVVAPLVTLEPEPPAPVVGSAAAAKAFAAAEAPEAPLASRLLDASRASGAREAKAPSEAPPPRPAPAPAKRSQRSEPVDRVALERLIGGRVFAAAGGLIVALGLAFFMKLAYDTGWLGAIPPAGRCIAGAAIGFGLLLAGEWARKRAGVWAAAGLSSAGVATLYISAFIAYGVFGLIAAPVAFGALVLTATIGVVVAARAGAAPVAILSAIGAYLAPLLTATDANPVALPMYLTALLAGGLYLSVRRAEVFGALRPLCWTATVAMGGLWGLAHGSSMHAALLIFAGAAWALTHGELLLAARVASRSDSPDAAHDLNKALPWRSARPAMMSLLTTAWAVALGIAAGGPTGSGAGWMPEWFVAAALMPATFALASMTAGTLRILRDPPLTAEQRLGAALMVQSGALVAVVIALGLAGWAEVVAWLSLGVAGAVAAHWLRAPSLAIAGAAALVIATLRLIAYDAWQPTVSAGYHVAGLALSRWALLMAIAAAAWLASAWACAAARWLVAARIFAGAALAVAMASVVHADSQLLSIAAVWVALGAVIVTIGRAAVRPLVAQVGLIPVALGVTAMLGAGANWAQQPGLDIAGLTLTAWSWSILAAAGLLAVGSSALVGWAPLRLAALSACVFAAVLAAVAPAHEASSLVAVTWYWIALGGGMLLASRLERRLALLQIAFGALVLAFGGWAAVNIVFDTPAATIFGLGAGLLQAVAISAGALLIAGSLPRTDRWRPAIIAAAAFAGGLLFVSSSFEAARIARFAFDDVMAQRATISLWWAIYGAGLLILGSLRAWPACRFAGLGLLGAAGVKVVTFDLMAVDPAWRVVSMVGVGLMMLAVAVGYGRIAARRPALAAAPAADPEPAA